MRLSAPRAFAGFTFDEWVDARALMVGHERAYAETTELFSHLRSKPNGFQLSVECWALLSLLNEDCAARVQKAATNFNPVFRAKLHEAIKGYGSMVKDGTLQSEFERSFANEEDKNGDQSS